jgi:hypothetical protein
MRNKLLILFILSSPAIYSQKVIDVEKTDYRVTSSLFYTVGGSPVSNAKYIRVVEGSPYFNESWMKGSIVMSGGAVYDSITVRLDLVDNSLQYMSPEGKEMIATSSIKGITLRDSVTGMESRFVHSSFMQATGKIDEGWYQLLAAGNSPLYKRYVKIITENAPYGSATVEQIINTSSRYFIMINSVLTPIKKFKDIPDLLSEKKNELKLYISSKNLSGKSDVDYSALITYYNNMVGK